MKKASMIFLSFLLAASLSTPVLAEEESGAVAFEEVGMNITLPDEVWNAGGYFEPYPAGALDYGHHVYALTFIYEAMPADQAEEMMYSADLTEEEEAELIAKQTLLTVVLATDKDLDTAVSAFNKSINGNIFLDVDSAEEVGSADGFTFYAVPIQSDEYVTQIDEDFAMEYMEIEEALLEAERNAEFFAPVDPEKEMSGEKLEFTTKDKDGNTVTSEELFPQNEITMLNFWGMWCPNCTGEMAELAEIHTRMQEKGCGIIGVEFEKVPTPETYEEAAAFLEENGVTYPNVLMPDELLTQLSGFPTSIFVDKEGTIVGIPLVGARVDDYEDALDELLAERSGTPAMPGNTAKKHAAAVYRVNVTDEDGPVEGVAVQYCDDTTCSFEFTDADGTAILEGVAGGDYEVHILKVPEGYKMDDTVYHTTGTSELNIQLEKES